ncbi:VOC family protein [Marininema halotolerans]|uniref:Glyoxalase/Bleomycin resistance protein/Dioxygenase superfamily protein n=1 Tax=Marininema halotolerans TaxID=1155944 RepID=A0A1I6RHI8_9BACL|nr:VOC family protein [Marininema halotolerans]SFS63938.1 Glyoxalase/Bleomycin resistance protein/Dioxygenase superfamily protein [Marininema halotolerans]
MKIISSAVSVTVKDVKASSMFLKKYFCFTEKWSAEGFAYLTHEGNTIPIVFLEQGNEILPEGIRRQFVSGLIIAFVVKDIEAEEKRLKKEGVVITAELQEDPWGERLFQVTDPNGVTIQIVEFVEPSDKKYANDDWINER